MATKRKQSPAPLHPGLYPLYSGGTIAELEHLAAQTDILRRQVRAYRERIALQGPDYSEEALTVWSAAMNLHDIARTLESAIDDIRHAQQMAEKRERA